MAAGFLAALFLAVFFELASRRTCLLVTGFRTTLRLDFVAAAPPFFAFERLLRPLASGAGSSGSVVKGHDRVHE